MIITISNKRKQTDTCNNMDDSQKHCTEKSNTKGYMLYDLFIIIS